MKIVIMRHGQPEIDLDLVKKQKMTPRYLGEIVTQYELTGLNCSQTPPTDSKVIAEGCNVSLSSNLPRAIASVQLLGLSEKNLTDECFSESRLPYLNWNKPSLSFFTWAILFRIAWLFGFSKNGESIRLARKRAKIGAAKLHDLAHSHNSVLLLGHGIMNRLLVKELKSQGWAEKKNTGEKYWSYIVFEFTS